MGEPTHNQLRTLLLYDCKLGDYRDEVSIHLSDGGLATIHHTGEYFLTTYYQDRIQVEWREKPAKDIFSELSEGKVYCKEWENKDKIDDEMIADGIEWLGGNTLLVTSITNPWEDEAYKNAIYSHIREHGPSVQFHCKKCGSDDLKWDAWAKWDNESQQMQLAEHYDHCECNNCEEKCTPVESLI